jgi:hypothetical protein
MKGAMVAHPLVRISTGYSSLEITIAAFLMVVFSAIGIDLSLIMLGMSLNDSACRDAARAAAQTSTQSNAIKAAQSQLQVHGTDGYWISQPTLRSTSAPYFVYQDFGGNPPANTSPYVTVTTTVNIRCPAPIFFFGTQFMVNGTIQFNRQYTFPIIKLNFYG